MGSPDPDSLQTFLMYGWLVLLVVVCVFAGKGFAAWLLEEPKSLELLIHLRREAGKARVEAADAELEAFHDDTKRELATELEARHRVLEGRLRDEERYRDKMVLAASAVAIVAFIIIWIITIEVGEYI